MKKVFTQNKLIFIDILWIILINKFNRWVFIIESPYEYDIGIVVIAVSDFFTFKLLIIENELWDKLLNDNLTIFELPVVPDVGINNLKAQSFYKKIGYEKLQVTPSQDGLFMTYQL